MPSACYLVDLLLSQSKTIMQNVKVFFSKIISFLFIFEHDHNATVIGSDIFGLRAVMSLPEAGFKAACVTKLFPTRSHAAVARGRINSALGSMEEDDWTYHA